MDTLQQVQWRLIQHPPARGAWNMAVDEALLLGMSRSDALPVLRLYAWQPACLSLGYAQSYQEVNYQAVENHGWEVVRRPTGGRAILHTDELTYAVIAPHSEPRLAGGVLESYRRLARALLQALLDLGIAVQSQSQPEGIADNKSKAPVCFEVPSTYEITADGKKLVGSAQARRKEGVLQHGSLPLGGDLTRITIALDFSNQAQQQIAALRLSQRATTAEACLGHPLAWDTAAQTFISAFSRELNLELMPSELTKTERSLAEELAQKKYQTVEWTRRV